MKSNLAGNFLMKTIVHSILILFLSCLVYSCKDDATPSEKDIVRKPELFPERFTRNLRELVEYAATNGSRINDTTSIDRLSIARKIYEGNGYSAIWSEEGSWISLGDSLLHFIDNCKEYGLFPSDYNYRALQGIRKQVISDTLSKKDAALWSRADLLMTDALLRVSEHLKRGRLPYDSLSRKDTFNLSDSFYLAVVSDVVQAKAIKPVLDSLEPKLPGYIALRNAAKKYVDSTEFRMYTYLPYPFQDSLAFLELLQKRFYEEGMIDSLPPTLDTLGLRKLLAKYQTSRKLKASGKVNEPTIKSLNDTPWERFKRIAISLDKYKLMKDTMPHTYIWVNIPSYYLKVVEQDTVVLESKVIVGASATRTPELHSEISNFITYPQWTVPYSIVFKEMLPAIQKDTNYLKKQNLIVVDRYDSVIPPSKIEWAKLSRKKFPYEIKQREGDDNSLGVMKFNFRNRYSVYLHDTNARWMFQKTSRALSHGCVRVQDWRDLAHFLVRNDTIKYPTDTLSNWIVRQEKHVVTGFQKLPLFIRYFTCEGKDGSIRFYDDVYGDDKVLAEKYFAKNIY